MSNKSASFKVYQTPKHCIAVYNTQRQDFTSLNTLDNHQEVKSKNMAMNVHLHVFNRQNLSQVKTCFLEPSLQFYLKKIKCDKFVERVQLEGHMKHAHTYNTFKDSKFPC